MPTEFAIVDLFAGPGGLAEGFSSIRSNDGSRPFQIAFSVEKEASAFETLQFRSFFRQFDGSAPADYYRFLNGEISEPDWKSLFPIEWEHACLETAMLELGSSSAAKEIDARLKAIKKSYGRDVILIGGPPCQAYSLVGRARNKGTLGYEASKDHRHFLYKEYIRQSTRLPRVLASSPHSSDTVATSQKSSMKHCSTSKSGWESDIRSSIPPPIMIRSGRISARSTGPTQGIIRDFCAKKAGTPRSLLLLRS